MYSIYAYSRICYGGGTAVATQAAIKEVSTSDEFENALNDDEISEIHITNSFEHIGALEVGKVVVIENGNTLTLKSFSTRSVSGAGSIVNNGIINITGDGTCVWTVKTTGTGKITANNKMWGEYRTFVDFGCVPDEMLKGSNCCINIITGEPYVDLPQNMKTGDIITPKVTNLIKGVDIEEVFNFDWRNGSSAKIYSGATSPTLTESGTLKLTLSTKTPYVMRLSNITYGSIETSGTVTQATLDSVYVDATNGNDSNLGNSAGAAVKSLRTALNKVSEGKTIILQSNCDMNSVSFNKNVTIKSADNAENKKYTLNTQSSYPNYINNGITVTFDTVNLLNTKFAGSTGPGNFEFNNCEGSGISITSGIADNITINNSDLSGTFYATTKLILNASTVSGKFTTKDFEAKGNCRLNLEKNAPAVIKGDVEFKENALIAISTKNIARGEKLIEVPSGTNDNIVNHFNLENTQSNEYALKCRTINNKTYIGISECISTDKGKFAVAYEPVIGGDIKNSLETGSSRYISCQNDDYISVKSGVWSGNTQGNTKWSLGDKPKLEIKLSANDGYHFDEHFSVNDLKIYSRKNIEVLPDYSDATLNSSVTKSIESGQGVSEDGRTFTFTITYPQVAKQAQTITVDTNNLDLECKGEATRKAIAPGTVTYSSNNEQVATVDENGKVTAKTAGNATITVSAAATDTCEAASVSYTVTVSHKYGDEYTHDDTNHWKECACGAKDGEAAHSGGTADCVTEAKCEVCEASYGTVDTSNHKGSMSYTENNSATHKKICDACKAVVAAEESHNFVNNVCSECGYKRVTGGGGSYNPVQKPEIITGEGGKTSLENNGTTLVITPDEGMEISKVTVNGKEVTVTDNKLTGLKTGDKVEVTFAKIPPTKEEIDKIFKEKALKLELIVRTSKTPKKNIKAVVKETTELKDLIKEIKDAGYTVKYKFYRSTKKSSKYEAKITKTEGRYINTIGKKGTKYYYKAKLLIYDNKGSLIAQTELKQCKYGLRTWSK